MKSNLFIAIVLFGVLVVPGIAAEPVIKIDDSSYESLLKAACCIQQVKTERTMTGGGLYLPGNDFWDAVVKFDLLDLPFIDIFSEQVKSAKRPVNHWESWARGESWPRGDDFVPDPRWLPMKFAPGIAERLFRVGRIDEGIAYLKEMLPPRDETDGMFAAGFVSGALVEQKRFDLAWQILNSGDERNRISNISVYIGACVRADTETHRVEALRALESLKTLLEQTDDENQRRSIRIMLASVLVKFGQYEEAVATAGHPSDATMSILAHQISHGTQEEIDYWFQRHREALGEERVTTSSSLLWTCLNAGKFLEAMDIIERNAGDISTESVFYQIPTRNVETDFRYNSRELVDRLIKQNAKITDNERRGGIPVYRQPFYPNVIKAQLNLGRVDEALGMFRTMDEFYLSQLFRDGGPEFAKVLSDFLFYSIKNLPTEEAKRLEAKAVEIFLNSKETYYDRDLNRDSLREMSNVRSHLISAYTQAAIRLMQEGETEKGNHFLEIATQKAKEEALRPSAQADAPLFSRDLSILCERLLLGGFFDETLRIVERYEGQYLLPVVHVRIAEQRAASGET